MQQNILLIKPNVMIRSRSCKPIFLQAALCHQCNDLGMLLQSGPNNLYNFSGIETVSSLI